MNYLRTNPNLIVWPNSKISFALSESNNKVRQIYPYSLEISTLLSKIIKPTKQNEIEILLSNSNLDFRVSDLVELGMLTDSQTYSDVHSWDGFKIESSSLNPNRINSSNIQEKGTFEYPIYVVDDLFNSRFMQSISKWFNMQSFSMIDIDRPETDFSKHWVKLLESNYQKLMAIEIFSWIDALSRNLFSQHRLNLTECKAYMSPYGDTATYHKDSEIGPTFTTILYSNLSWDQNWGGELIICDSDGEPNIAIAPKPGRLVFFRSDILHKAGTPSRLAFSPRLALVFRYEIQ